MDSDVLTARQARQPYCLSGWNVLDFIIVVIGLVEFLPSVGGGSSALRALRVLRPLRAVNKLKSLRVIVTTLFNTLPDLAQVALVLAFMFLIFGIMGLQLFNGVLRNRCVDIASGDMLEDGEFICSPTPGAGARTCPSSASCEKVGDNLGNGVLHFDDIGHALLAVYLIVDMSGWAELMYAVQDAAGKAVWIYFVLIIVTVSFFAMNLVLAVVVQEFETVSSDADEEEALRQERAALEAEMQSRADKPEGTTGNEKNSADLQLSSVLLESGPEERSQAADGALLTRYLRAASGSIPVYEFVGPDQYTPSQVTELSNMQRTQEPIVTVPFRSRLVNSHTLGSGELHTYEATLSSGKSHIHVFVGKDGVTQRPRIVSNPSAALGALLLQSGQGAEQAVQQGHLRAISWPVRSGSVNVYVFEESSFPQSAGKSFGETGDSKQILLHLPHVTPERAADGYLQHVSTSSGIRLFEFTDKGNTRSVFENGRGESQRRTAEVATSPEQCLRNVAAGLTSDPEMAVVNADIKRFMTVLNPAKTVPNLSILADDTQQWDGHSLPTISTVDKLQARELVRKADLTIKRDSEWLVGKPKWILTAFAIVSSFPFQATVNAAIVANTIVLALDYHGIDEQQLKSLDAANLFFTIFFLLEVVLKLVAFGPTGFARDRFNLFDAAVVVASLVELAVANGGGVVSVLRSVRLVRLLRLLKQFPSLRVLLSTVAQSIPDVSWMALLMALFVFIFAILGQQLFAGSLAGLPDPPVFTFATFGDSILTSVTILSNDDWDEIMFDGVRCCGEGAVAFFLIGQVLGMYIILSLFIAILLRRFAEQDDEAFDREDLLEYALKIRKEQLKSALQATSSSPSHLDENGAVAAVALRAQVLRFERAELRKKQRARHNLKIPTAMTGYSFGLAPPDAPARILMYNMVTSTVFEAIVFCLILLNCVFLALDRPTLESSSGLARAIRGMDFFFAFVFLFEMVAKMIAHGLWFPDGRGYFRNNWNILDATVVVISFISLGFPQVSFARALRALRPLRLVVRSKNIQVVVNALVAALPGMGNVIVLAAVLWTVFAIMGTNLFKGGFYECTDPTFDSKERCLAASNSSNPLAWVPLEGTDNANFDNVGNSMLLLFQIATLSGWGQLMHAAISIRGEDLAPSPGHNPAASLFFIAFVIIGGFFMVSVVYQSPACLCITHDSMQINLAVGVVIDNFNRLKALYDGSAFLTKAQQRYYYARKIVFAAQSQLTTLLDKPKAAWRAPFHAIAVSPLFEQLVFAAIILNTVLMMAQHYEQPSSLDTSLVVFNVLFVLFFTAEAVIKVLGVRGGFWTYWKDPWNKFDALVLLLSYVSLFSDSGAGTSVIRVFRVVRVFRLIKSAPTLRRLTQTLLLSAPSLLNIGALLVVLFFMLSVLGVSLFGDIVPTEGSEINRHANFVEFGDALELTWRISTGDAWEAPMYATMAAKGPASAIYFVAVQLVLSFVFLQLFIAVILEQFGEDLEARISTQNTEDGGGDENNTVSHNVDGNPIESAPSHSPVSKVPQDGVNGPPPPGWTPIQSLQSWATVWNQLDTLATKHIKASLFNRLMKSVPPPFGFGTGQLSTREIVRRCLYFNIPIYLVDSALVKRQKFEQLTTGERGAESSSSSQTAKERCWSQCRPPCLLGSQPQHRADLGISDTPTHRGILERQERNGREWCLQFEPTLLALAQIALKMDVAPGGDKEVPDAPWRLHEYLAAQTIERWWSGNRHESLSQRLPFAGRHKRGARARTANQATGLIPAGKISLRQPVQLPTAAPISLESKAPASSSTVTARQPCLPTPTRVHQLVRPADEYDASRNQPNPLVLTREGRQSPPLLPQAEASAAKSPEPTDFTKQYELATVQSPRRKRTQRALALARSHLVADSPAVDKSAQLPRSAQGIGAPAATFDRKVDPQEQKTGVLPHRQKALSPASAVRIRLALKRVGERRST